MFVYDEWQQCTALWERHQLKNCWPRLLENTAVVPATFVGNGGGLFAANYETSTFFLVDNRNTSSSWLNSTIMTENKHSLWQKNAVCVDSVWTWRALQWEDFTKTSVYTYRYITYPCPPQKPNKQTKKIKTTNKTKTKKTLLFHLSKNPHDIFAGSATVYNRKYINGSLSLHSSLLSDFEGNFYQCNIYIHFPLWYTLWEIDCP